MNETRTQYVAGFMFRKSLNAIALIRKCKPAWQAGKLNGIGGKIEAGEGALDAMVREFREETGTETDPESWSHFCDLRGADFTVHFFVTEGDVHALGSPEEEKVEVVMLGTVSPQRLDMIENLPWLISLAVDHLSDGRPSFATVEYDRP